METRQVNMRLLWPGMNQECQECSRRLVDGMKAVKGLEDISTTSTGQEVTILYDPSRTSLQEIMDRASLLGASINSDFIHAKIHVSGLDCPDCAMKLEASVRRIEGVVWASLNFASSIMLVEYKSTGEVMEKVEARIRSLGYKIEDSSSAAQEKKQKYDTRIIITTISGVLLLAGVLTRYFTDYTVLANVMLLVSAVVGGIRAARFGFLALLSRTFDTNFLMTLAAVGAIALGEYSEAAAVMFLYSLGSALESFTADKTRRSIYSLIQSLPKTAHVKTESGISDILLDNVRVGQIMVIKPGEMIPLDGVVRVGESDVNESQVSGESLPVDKEAGARVYAGSVNGFGSLEVVVSSISSESTVSRVVKLVENAQSQKAKTQSFSERFGAIYTPCVITAAILIAVVGPYLFGGDSSTWVHRSLVLLVVACPCALVISTPVAIVAAIGHLATKGVLIKGGIHLETLGKLDSIGFDKTGTLTTGKLEVSEVLPAEGVSEQELLQAAAAVESRSEHPISEAILIKTEQIGLSVPDVGYFRAIAGKGAVAVTESGEIAVGSLKFMQELDISSVVNVGSVGKSSVYVAQEGKLLGAVTLSDSIRPEAAESIRSLRESGVRTISLITGDSAEAAAGVASTLGIDQVNSSLLPEQKLEIVNKMSENSTTAVVGDGINDAPALAAAHVGIAMRGLGNEAAVQAADVVLMGDNLSMLPYAVRVSKKTRQIIIQNTVVALTTVGILLTGAFVGKIGLTAGVFGHEGSALLVIVNSMRLLAGVSKSDRA